jgi:hypothetical protein
MTAYLEQRPEVAWLGRNMMSEVRERAIEECRRSVRGEMQGHISKRATKAVRSAPSSVEAVEAVTPIIVDVALYYVLLFLGENESVDLRVRLGEQWLSVAQQSDGLNGDLLEWIEAFSPDEPGIAFVRPDEI